MLALQTYLKEVDVSHCINNGILEHNFVILTFYYIITIVFRTGTIKTKNPKEKKIKQASQQEPE